ncbi:MAG: chondroitinase family polysaccharide lyase [Alistipes sp.]
MRKIALFVAVFLWTGLVSAQTPNEVSDPHILSFEGSVAPLEAVSSGKIACSDAHFKHATQSAQWCWRKRGAQVRIAQPIGYLAANPNPKETSVSTFLFWVYAPRPLEGSLHFEFRKAGKRCAWFDYGLSFTGWRGAWVAFDRDMQGTPVEGMDELVITANCPAGELYFDHLILSSFQDVRQHTADFQAPFINAATNSHWLILLRSWHNKLEVPIEKRVSATQQSSMDSIENRLSRLLLNGKKIKSLKKLRTLYEGYDLRENTDGTLRGKPIWFVRYAEAYINLGHTDINKLYNKNRQTLRQCNDLLYDMAVAYHGTTDKASREELATLYVRLTRHLLDQGFAAGSAQGTLHHLGYSMRNFYTAPVLMREVLQEAGLLHEVQQAMEWFSGVGEVKLKPKERGIDIDAFNTSLIGRLASILLLPDSPEKVAYLQAFSRWADNGYKIAEGTAPCFKSDGTVFHHRHHYPAYAVGGFDGAVNAVWLLNSTDFSISHESHAILKRALLEMRFYCNQTTFPLALSGRHPDGEGALIPWHYARLAEAGTPDGKQPLDRELAAAYMRLTDSNDRQSRQFAAQGIAPEKSPEGNRTYGYNASMSHRRGDWLWTIAGHSRYLWAAEIYQGANHYGRYLTHGSTQLLGNGEPVNAFDSGFRKDGWDWCHIPGTTAAILPMAQMRADIRNVDTVSGYEEMLLSDESFAGGVSHEGRNGLYAMKLHEHDKYNGSLRARKSYFLFDNRMVALGSNIENALPDREVHTTLFQNQLDSLLPPIGVNGEQVCAFPYDRTLPGGVLVDNLHNAYFVPRGELHVKRTLQHSLDEETDRPTQHNFTTAYLNHGTMIDNGSYEYLTVVHASDAEIAAYTSKLPYNVQECTSRAHIVRDLPTQTVAYALFEAGAVQDKLLLEVSLPSLVMISGTDNEKTVSVCDPDLHLYEGASDEVFDAQGKRTERSIYSRTWINNPSAESQLSITLHGHWQANSPTAGCRVEQVGDNTMVTFTCREAATRELKLRRLETR